MSFEWQTDESDEWGEWGEADVTPEARRRRRWPWLVFVLLVVVGGAGWVVYRELSRRVDVGTTNVETDLLTSYEVVQTAVSNQDSDLLSNFLSGVDSEWVQTVTALVENGRFYDRTPLHLQWLPPQTVLSPTITFSPDLSEAELVTEQAYAIEIGNGLTETIHLQETAVYRLGSSRWLLSPPKPEFWGEAQTFTGEILVLHYPDRDAEIARRLARDIDTKLLELCAKFPELHCSDDLEVRLALTSNSEWLNSAQGVSVFWLPHIRLQELRLTPMPTPSLIGIPTNESGYQALYRGYASVILSAVVADLLDAECCFDSVLYQAALADMMAQLSLQPWPLAASDYQRFLLNPKDNPKDNPAGWADLQLLWEEKRPFPTPVQDWAAYALVDYVVNELGLLTIVEFQESLVAFAERPYTDWIEYILAPLQSNLLPEQAWLNFLYEKSESAQLTPPFPLPNQSLYQICQDKQTNWSLVRYDLAANEFSYLSRAVRGPAFLQGLPADVGVVVGEQISSESTSDLFLWANGNKTEISWPRTANTPGVVPLLPDPTGQRLLLSGPPQNPAPFGVFPVASCLAGDSCDLEVADGYPIWSQDGTQTLVAVDFAQLDDVRLESVLHLGNRDGIILDVSEEGVSGAAPFWLENGRFGFTQFDVALGETVVYLQSIGAEEPTLLFTASDLTQALAEDMPTGLMRIDYVVPYPQDANRLLVATADALRPQGAAHLFVYNMVDGTVQHRFAFLNEPTTVRRGYRFSPNGRFLAITSLTAQPGQLALYLHDLQTGAIRTILLDDQYTLPAHHYLDWSADGNWLAFMQDGYTRIMHPATGYERWAVSPVLDCSLAAWVSDEMP